MNRRAILLPVLVLALFPCGCGIPTAQQSKSALELQAFQKREFKTSKQTAFASTVSVFQDFGYTIRAADLLSGFIQAQSPTRNSVSFFSQMDSTEATAFIEELNTNSTTVRLNFVQVSESSYGGGMRAKSDTPVVNPAVYENAFVKIQEAIFIRASSQ